MKNKISFKKWLSSIFVGSNIKTKWPLFIIFIGILVLMPYNIKSDQFFPIQLGSKPMNKGDVGANGNYIFLSLFSPFAFILKRNGKFTRDLISGRSGGTSRYASFFCRLMISASDLKA